MNGFILCMDFFIIYLCIQALIHQSRHWFINLGIHHFPSSTIRDRQQYQLRNATWLRKESSLSSSFIDARFLVYLRYQSAVPTFKQHLHTLHFSIVLYRTVYPLLTFLYFLLLVLVVSTSISVWVTYFYSRTHSLAYLQYNITLLSLQHLPLSDRINRCTL